MKKPLRYLALLLTVFFLASCSKPEPQEERVAFTSILPQRDFVRHIAGDRFEVHALVGSGQNPHSYTPTPDQMVQLSKASLFFSTGIEVEDGVLPKIEESMPNINIVDLRQGIELREMIEKDHHDHEHKEKAHHSDEHVEKDDHHHEHEGKDPHIWLSPVLAKQMAVTIKDALVQIDPDGQKVYEENVRTFSGKLDSLDNYLRTILEPVKGSELFVFHPAFGYFTDAYGLIQKPVETGGKEPSARDLARLIDEAREHKPKVIFVQPQYAQKSAKALADQIGCAVVPINPLPEDYLKEMREMGRKVQEGLNVND